MSLLKLKRWLLRLSIPFQRWIQRRGRREVVITKKIVDHLVSITKPGDILLSYEAQRYTSIFIKGFYDHAVIATCYLGELHVVEAVGDLWVIREGARVNLGGVRLVPLEEWLWKKDYVAIVRVNLTDDIREAASENALKYVGRGYDYSFSHDNEEIYCSELPYVCYRTEWSKFLAELGDDIEILPQIYWDYTEHNICAYLVGVLNTKLEEDKFLSP